MTDEELKTLVKIPDNVPVSFLEELKSFSDEVLMLASEPNDKTETGYMSKYFTYGDLESNLYQKFGIDFILSEISNIWQDKIGKIDPKTLKCDVESPYIISAIYQDENCMIADLSGYRLRDGMKTVFSQDDVEADLQKIIPSLSENSVHVATAGNVITSITDMNGHVVSVGEAEAGYGIGSSTKVASTNCAVSSVTTNGGKVTAVGSVPFSTIVNPFITGLAKVYIKDIHDDPAGSPAFSNSDLTNLSVLRLTESQLNTLKSNGQIVKNVLYMTSE